MKFYKMHGIGNDYIYMDCIRGKVENPSELAKRLSDRHFSIGGDGLILLCTSKVADIRMRMFNADGSEGKMCGNGIRCLAKLAYDLKYVHSDMCSVETPSGIKWVEFIYHDGNVTGAKVDMGKPLFSPSDIPCSLNMEKVMNYPYVVGGKEYNISLVSMGNPHCVVFEDPKSADLEKTGPLFEKNALFPEGVNTEFIKVLSPNEIEMRVWERGSGETLACGTGACASAVVCCELELCKKGEKICVHLLGGDLIITYKDTVYMQGAATLAFTGDVEI